MSGEQAHDHTTDAGSTRLGWTLALIVLDMAAEVAGGLASGSLALLADAGHMASDAAALGLTLSRCACTAAAFIDADLRLLPGRDPRRAGQRGDPRRHRGPHRRRSRRRLARRRRSEGVMLAVAIAGLRSTSPGCILLRGSNGAASTCGAPGCTCSPTRSAAPGHRRGGAIWVFGWSWIDPAASMAIALLVVYSAWSLLRESVAVFMEGAPQHIEWSGPRRCTGVSGVREVHDLQCGASRAGSWRCLLTWWCGIRRRRQASFRERRRRWSSDSPSAIRRCSSTSAPPAARRTTICTDPDPADQAIGAFATVGTWRSGIGRPANSRRTGWPSAAPTAPSG